jgi:hypothetical protein
MVLRTVKSGRERQATDRLFFIDRECRRHAPPIRPELLRSPIAPLWLGISADLCWPSRADRGEQSSADSLAGDALAVHPRLCDYWCQ